MRREERLWREWAHGEFRSRKLKVAHVLITGRFVQIGELNTVHLLWQYADLEERRSRREQSWSVPGWSDTVHKTVPLIQTMKSRILVPMPWSAVA